MSATGRGTVREARDFYSTPTWSVRRLLEAQGAPINGLIHQGKTRWLEPGAGSGAIIRTVNTWCADVNEPKPDWTAIELMELVPGTLAGLGARTIISPYLGQPDPLGDEQWDLALGNPPYSLAMEFIEQSLKHARYVCFLLRIPFLASQKRADFMRDHTPDVYVLPDRPSFTGKGTDATDYGWFMWDRERPRGYQGTLTVLDSTDAEEKKQR